MAERIFNKDLLLCYPYESMEPFLCLLEQAANDPRVQAVRITLYRVGDHPRIADALMQAARNGKEVTVVLELQARFDERNNLLLSARLMEAGCTLLYGMEEGKVHAKVCQIVYRSANGPNRIITQFGTGNYNPATARQYTDYCLMTADPELGREAAAWFRRVAVGGPTGRYRRLLASPDGMADALLRRIQGQVDRAQRGLPCGIFLKVNALSDRAIVRGLLRASRAGVPVRLLVRGMCRLIPGPEDGPLGDPRHCRTFSRALTGILLWKRQGIRSLFVFGRPHAAQPAPACRAGLPSARCSPEIPHYTADGAVLEGYRQGPRAGFGWGIPSSCLPPRAGDGCAGGAAPAHGGEGMMSCGADELVSIETETERCCDHPIVGSRPVFPA